jgi:mycothiol synthase
MATTKALLRPPRFEEASAVADLLNAHSRALNGEPSASTAEIESWLTNPVFDVERDLCVAVGTAGELLGYADLGEQGEDGTRLWIDLRVPPANAAVSPVLLDAMESRARAKAVPGALLRTVVDQDDHAYRELLEARGYGVVRSSFRMSIDFGGAPAESALPAGIEIRLAHEGEERALHAVFRDAFRDGWDFTPQPFAEFVHWNWTGEAAEGPRLVATDGEEPAGIALCRPSAHGDDTRGWVEVLGVRRPWRGRGIATALLLSAFADFHRRGLRGAALAVDTGNVTGAVRLYEHVGMRAARRSDTYERPIDG